MIKALNKAFLCRLFSVSCKQDASDYEQNTPEYFLFQELPEKIQNKIVYVYSAINEYSLRSRDVHSTPSWHKWSDFEYRPWRLAIIVRTPPGPTSSHLLEIRRLGSWNILPRRRSGIFSSSSYFPHDKYLFCSENAVHIGGFYFMRLHGACSLWKKSARFHRSVRVSYCWRM